MNKYILHIHKKSISIKYTCLCVHKWSTDDVYRLCLKKYIQYVPKKRNDV